MATCSMQTLSNVRIVDSLRRTRFSECLQARPAMSCRLSLRPSSSSSSDVLQRKSLYLGVKICQASKIQTTVAAGRQLRIEAAKRVSSSRSLVLTSTLVAEEGKEEEVMKLCKGILAWADERKKDKKSGFQHFECNIDAYEKNVFHFWERYDSFPYMNDARASPEHCKFMDEVRPLLAAPVALAAYEYRDGQLGCMMNPIGPKGEGGLDDATGQGGSGGGASYQQTSAGVQQGLAGSQEGKKAWGMDKALQMSASKQGQSAANAAASAAEAATSAAQKIAEGLANLFGTKKRK